MPPDDSFERAARARLGRADARIAGVDEAGRGPWAGPVCAAACVLAPGAAPEGLDDSKKLSASRRAALAQALRALAEEGRAELSVAFAEVAEIDRLGLGPATDLAMIRALGGLPSAPDVALVDGRRLPRDMFCPGEPVVRGDGRSLAIAAASILAKTARDAVMDALARQHPNYGWDTNRGYGTAGHAAALARWGVTQHHRCSFKPIHKILVQEHSTNC
ncbi:MAG: ribonuclease HII [Pseudomonadota bacterium]